MDPSEVGKYGTLCLMKRLEPDTVVAAYPIDDPELSFGRDPSCSIRLYYDAVSAVHCKIVFHDRKAFLVVLGTNGLLVDGCPVFPAPASPGAAPVTVPLPNNSTVEIHRKRFRFSYPPKELRAALLATPEPHRRRRALRMSMIQSAQVFTPRPSANGQENLRILKTPIRSPWRGGAPRRRESSPLKRGAYVVEEDEDEEGEGEGEGGEEEIVLVETNHPRVVEEDRDLVILERVPVREPPPPAPPPEPQPQPQRQVQFPFVAPAPLAPPQTPLRRPPRASLHRAVLIRSAQRAALRVEMEREEEEEEEEEVEEVEEAVQPLDVAMEDVREEDEGEGEEEDDAGEAGADGAGPLSSLRKSLTAVKNAWPFRSVARNEEEAQEPAPEDGDGDEEQDITEAHDEPADVRDGGDEPMVQDHEQRPQQEEEHPEPARPTPSFAIPPRIPHRPPPLGKFMTPQASRHRDFGIGIGTGTSRSARRAYVRYSVGGFTPGGVQGLPQAQRLVAGKAEGAPSGPRRVRLVEPWRVEDIVVPVAEEEGEDEDEEELKEEEEEENVKEERGTPEVPPPTPSRGRREKLSGEQRQAIIERRRSALRTPDAFFGGQTPGARRLSLFPLSPAKPSTAAPPPLPALSTLLGAPSAASVGEEDSKADVGASGAPEEDTSVLLARMRQMVEGARRRQSVPAPRPSVALAAPSSSSAQGFSLLAPDAHRAASPVTPVLVPTAGEDEREGSASDGGGGDGSSSSVAPAAADADVEMETEVEVDPNDGSVPPVQHATPSLAGVREMFAQRAAVAAATPRLDGVRGLFRRERVLETPVFEGVGAMLATPVGFRRAEPELEPEEELQQAEQLETHAEEARREEPYGHDGRGERDRQDKNDEHAEHDEHSERESSHDEGPSQAARGKRPAPASRAQKPRATRSTPKTAPATRQEPRDELPAAVEEDTQDARAVGASRVTRKPRLRSASAEPKQAEPQEAAPAKPTTRRTRKATASPPAAEEAPAATRRRTRRTPTPEVHSRAPPSTSTSTRRAGKARAASVVSDADDDDDDDPLDSIARARSPEIPLPGAAPAVRRSARGKLTMAIKEEDEESGEARAAPAPAPAPAPAARTVRGRRPVGATSIPRSVGSGRGARTAATSARRPTAQSQSQSATRAVRGAAKENTPDAESPADEDAAEGSARPKSSLARTAPRGKALARGAAAGRVRAPEQPEQPGTAARASRVKARK